MELQSFANVGNCSNCTYPVHVSTDWNESRFGRGNLYHTHTGSLLCNINSDQTVYAAIEGCHTYITTERAPETFDPPAVCTLVVTFTDGEVREYPETRFAETRTEPDPIVINGSTVVIENMEQTTTLLNVRSFQMEF